MAVAFRDASSAQAGAQSGTIQQLNVDTPVSVVAGDQMFILVGLNSNMADYTLSTPSGWTLLRQDESGSQYATMFHRQAQVGDAGSSVTFQVEALLGGTGAKVVADLVAYSGANLDVHAALGHVSSTTHPTPVITPTSYPATIVVGLSKKSSSLTDITPPVGYTSRIEHLDTGGGGIGVGWADASLASGDSDGGSWTTDAASAAASTFSVALTETPPPATGAEILYRSGGAWVPAEVVVRSGGVWVPAEVVLRQGGTWN